MGAWAGVGVGVGAARKGSAGGLGEGELVPKHRAQPVSGQGLQGERGHCCLPSVNTGDPLSP